MRYAKIRVKDPLRGCCSVSDIIEQMHHGLYPDLFHQNIASCPRASSLQGPPSGRACRMTKENRSEYRAVGIQKRGVEA